MKTKGNRGTRRASVFISTDIPYSAALFRLSNREFRRQLYAAINGEQNHFSGFIKLTFDRKPPGWDETRLRIFERDNYTCAYCGSVDGPWECDHIVPVSKGGSDFDSNLTAACRPCNRSKRAMSVEEWKAVRLG